MNIMSVLIWLPIVVVVSLASGWFFQQGLIRIVNAPTAKFLRTAPLTASFGMLVIAIYVTCSVFAPIIAPFGESEICLALSSLGRRPIFLERTIWDAMYLQGWFMVPAIQLGLPF